jgi:hypothetical protein
VHFLTIAPRFCGPPGTANGGYASGLLAQHADGIVRVRLERPVPLARELEVHELADGLLELRDRDDRIALAEPARLSLDVPPAPGYLEAIEASRRYIGLHGHAFPGCFVCGPERARPDGLRIFAGSLAATGEPSTGESAHPAATVAAPWVPDISLGAPDGKVRPEFMWAALDCPGYFAARSDGVPMLLASFTAHVDRRVHVDESCVVIGWRIAGEGRKHEVGTALFDDDGILCAQAQALWIEPRKA